MGIVCCHVYEKGSRRKCVHTHMCLYMHQVPWKGTKKLPHQWATERVLVNRRERQAEFSMSASFYTSGILNIETLSPTGKKLKSRLLKGGQAEENRLPCPGPGCPAPPHCGQLAWQGVGWPWRKTGFLCRHSNPAPRAILQMKT